MTSGDRNELLLAQRTTDWLHRLRGGNAADRAAFVEWLRASPAHVREVLLAMTWEHVLNDFLDPGRDWDIEALTRRAADRSITPIEGSPAFRGAKSPAASDSAQSSSEAHESADLFSRKLGNPLRKVGLRIAAVAAIVAIVSHLTLSWFDSTISTDIGEWKTERLSDGTVVTLGPSTTLHVEFSDGDRSIALLHGEAVFEVREDASRPFIVRTDLASATAVGTRFAVSLEGLRTVVTVAEGVVSVSTRGSHSTEQRAPEPPPPDTLAVRAGEQVVVSPDTAPRVTAVNASRALAWAHKKLIFLQTPVCEVIREFNRRNRVKITLERADIANLLVTGTFNADQPGAFLATLEELLSSSPAADVPTGSDLPSFLQETGPGLDERADPALLEPGSASPEGIGRNTKEQ